jgi:hypothetical protein
MRTTGAVRAAYGAGALGLLLLTAGCGSGNKAADPAPTSSAVTTEATTAAPPTTPAPSTAPPADRGPTASATPGETMPHWPTTYDGTLPLRWHVPDSDTHGNSVVVSDIQDDPPRCTISVTVDGASGPWYKNVSKGATLEFAGRRWQITRIDAGKMDVDTGSSDFSPGRVDLKELGAA